MASFLVIFAAVLQSAVMGQVPARANVQTIDGASLTTDAQAVSTLTDLACTDHSGKVISIAWHDVDSVCFTEHSAISAGEKWIVETHSGDRLYGNIVGGDAKLLRFKNQLLGELGLPLKKIAKIKRTAASDRKAQAIGEEDVLELTNGDTLSGAVAKCSTDGVAFFDGKDDRELRWSDVAAIRLAQINKQDPMGIHYLVTLNDGSRIAASSVQCAGSAATVDTLLDQNVSIRMEQLNSIEPMGGKRTWLSMMAPAEYKATPYFDIRWNYERDLNVLGDPLRAKGRTYARGIGLHSACRISYALSKKHAHFRGLVAMDDSAGTMADAEVRIFVDGKLLKDIEHLTIRSEPKSLDIDISDGKLLTIEIGFGDNGDVQDRVDILNAALIEK